MKVLYIAAFLFLLYSVGSGQILPSPDAPKVSVIEKKWRVEKRNNSLDEDPFRDLDNTRQAIKDRKNTDALNKILISRGEEPVATTPVRINSSDDLRVSPADVKYIYEIRIKNTGEKAIKKIDCQYIFSDPETQKQVSYIAFEKTVNIVPGKTEKLTVISLSPPTGAIDATKADKKPRDQYSEQVIIQRIEYVDGSVWTAKSDSK